jgi:hypothetical protein
LQFGLAKLFAILWIVWFKIKFEYEAVKGHEKLSIINGAAG